MKLRRRGEGCRAARCGPRADGADLDRDPLPAVSIRGAALCDRRAGRHGLPRQRQTTALLNAARRDRAASWSAVGGLSASVVASIALVSLGAVGAALGRVIGELLRLLMESTVGVRQLGIGRRDSRGRRGGWVARAPRRRGDCRNLALATAVRLGGRARHACGNGAAAENVPVQA